MTCSVYSPWTIIVVTEQPTRRVRALLRRSGWIIVTSSGSHTKWRGPGGTSFTIPDGHRTISPGVYRRLLAAIEEDEHR
ncbi:type II toxin-antitoxin system HicA family toxin [Herbiconiux moechotypicola]|uniref:type II toxin-antitoxin system HicA family toxin n=1 Tax=Herbiconiux moechotypicola TaxID=637393 RepID=UPI0035C767FB